MDYELLKEISRLQIKVNNELGVFRCKENDRNPPEYDYGLVFSGGGGKGVS